MAQLDEAVRAYAVEDPGASIIVVVDATFEHRVSEDERDEVREAMLNGEVVSPPAGAIGRGDAFVLRIAERTAATVLSNDSFQEFHAEHPWLFDEGRLIGGKPVPGVGWIFTPRLPIRGPKSRAATADAKAKVDDPASPPAKAAELARAAKKAAKKAARTARKAPRKEATAPAATIDTSWPLTPAMPPPGRGKVDPAFSSAIHEAVEEALDPDKAPTRDKSGRHVKRAPEPAPPPASSKKKKKKRAAPPPAVNEPLAFINFVGAYGVGSSVEGEVVSFTSHGAMVDVSLPGGGVLHCYIPLSGMGTPPPTKARQMLQKGEVRPFLLAGLDPPRRVAELALPPSAAAASEPPTRPAAVKQTSGKKAAAAGEQPAKKGVPAGKAASRSTKKEPAEAKKSAPKRAAAGKTAVAKKTTTTQTAKKKTATTTQAAKKKSTTTQASKKKSTTTQASKKASGSPAKKRTTSARAPSAAKSEPRTKKAAAKKATPQRRERHAR